jgi:hypothetical protein
MLLEDIKSVLSFAAFRPDVDDADIPWAKRFEGRKSLLINIGRNQTSWKAVDKKGRLGEGGMQDGEFADVASQRAEEWRGLTDGGWCAISVNHRFIISLENNMMRGENCVSLLRSNPRAVLGPKFDRGKRYAISHHPEAATSMLLAVEESMVKVTEDVLKTIGMRPARVCCGLFAMMERTVGNLAGENRGASPSSFVLIGACEGSIAALCQQDGQWKDFRCRSGLGLEAVETTLQIVSPLIAKAPPGTPVFFVSDGQDEKFRSELMAHLEKVGARDLTQEDLLWEILGTY